MKQSIILGLLALIALLSISSAKPLHQNEEVGPLEARNQREVDFAYGILKFKKKEASDFCTTWLHLPPPKTTTITTTSTTLVTKPSQTSTVLASVTKTGDTATSTSTITTVKDEITTLYTTNIIPATTTVTVATVPSISTYLTITTSTVTSTVPAPLDRRGNNDRRKHPKIVNKHPEVPFWLKDCVNDAISKACSYFVSSTTITNTATNTYTATKITPGASLTTTTSTTTLTPTSVEYTTVTSTRTVPTTATVESISTSTIPATLTKLSITSTTSTTTTTTFTTLAPAIPTFARIKVTKISDNSQMGYIGGLDNASGTSTIVSSVADAAIFSYKSSTGLMNIKSPPGSIYPYFGAILGQTGSASTSLEDVQGGGYLNLGYVAKTAPGTQSTDSDQNSLAPFGYGGIHESQVWTLDPTSKTLTVTWTQGDGSPYIPNIYVVDIAEGIRYIELTSPNGLKGNVITLIGFTVENVT